MSNLGSVRFKKGVTCAVVLSLSALTASADLEMGLRGYYSFEGNYNNNVTTSALPSGTAVNSPTFSSGGGITGNALSLQGGDNDHMNLVASFGDASTIGRSFTVSAWYKLNTPLTSTNSTARYFVMEASDNYDISYGIRDLGVGEAGINDGQVYTEGANFNVSDAATDGWHHVVKTYTESAGSTIIHTYIDGSQKQSLTVSSNTISGAGINFGAARSSQSNRGFDGLIDEVAIWDRALTSAEASTVFAFGLNGKQFTSSAPASAAPVITTFAATPASGTIGTSSTLNWTVTGSDTVTLSETGAVAATGSQAITIDSSKTYTLVAIKGNTAVTEQISVVALDSVGPYIGTIKQTEAYFLYSPGQDNINLRLTVMTEAGATVTTDDSTSDPANDYVAKFHVTGLSSGTKYLYKIENVPSSGSPVVYAGDTPEHAFTTVDAIRTGKIFTTAMVSCVNDTSDLVWKKMSELNPDLLVLAGDTPYVDTGDLTSIHSKHRNLLKRPDLRDLIQKTSVIGTWDDHDFGLNGGNGVNTSSRKVNTRKGFVDYRAHDQYGDGSGNGIYHKADMGAIEFFMLDPRWFSQTTASPVDSSQPTCFGSAQWTWLLDAIRNSKAPFKVLVQGQIWQDKKNGETDDMFTYWAERDALLNIIRDEKIPGVVLFGGDIHVARKLMHPRRVGYDLHDFIMSPGHKSVISSLNVYHPSLTWSRESQNQFLTMTADTTKSVPELTVRFMDQDGNENHKTVITYDQLSYNEGSGLAKDLRAYWSFDSDLTNQTALGSRLDATAVNGATRNNGTGVQGGAVTFDRADSEYLHVDRSYLDDNASEYTASAWCKPSSLPAHGSSDRHFIMESYAHDHTGLNRASTVSTTGYAISVAISASNTNSSKVDLQLHTDLLDPVEYVTNPSIAQSLLAPGTSSPGPFSFEIDRSVFDNWAHVAVTFDSSTLKLYVNGVLAVQHTLTTPAPIAETGGLIIGGHRSGTGRNFDGLIDEVAIWNRTLDATDISTIYNSGTPAAISTSTMEIDTDGDALPDWWEDIHGLDSDDISDVTSDTDHDGLSAVQEFGFGTLPNVANNPQPYTQTTVEVSGTDYAAITYSRNPAAMKHMDQAIQRTTAPGTAVSWDTANTVVVSVVGLPSGLQQVTERSTIAMAGQGKEFLRVQFTPK